MVSPPPLLTNIGPAKIGHIGRTLNTWLNICIEIASVDSPMMPLVGSAGGFQERATPGRFFGPTVRAL